MKINSKKALKSISNLLQIYVKKITDFVLLLHVTESHSNITKNKQITFEIFFFQIRNLCKITFETGFNIFYEYKLYLNNMFNNN